MLIEIDFYLPLHLSHCLAEPECKSRIALLYFPIVKIAIDNLHLLTPQRAEVDASSTDPDTQDSHLELGEIRELLVTVLFVVRHCDPAVIKSYLAAHATAFFRLLDVCVCTFQYRGFDSGTPAPTERAVQTQVMKKCV
jgi:hypothetical protein